MKHVCRKTQIVLATPHESRDQPTQVEPFRLGNPCTYLSHCRIHAEYRIPHKSAAGRRPTPSMCKIQIQIQIQNILVTQVKPVCSAAKTMRVPATPRTCPTCPTALASFAAAIFVSAEPGEEPCARAKHHDYSTGAMSKQPLSRPA
jgi:hypothetical protein